MAWLLQGRPTIVSPELTVFVTLDAKSSRRADIAVGLCGGAEVPWSRQLIRSGKIQEGL